MTPEHYFKITAPAGGRGTKVEMDGEDISGKVEAVTVELSAHQPNRIVVTFIDDAVDVAGLFGLILEETAAYTQPQGEDPRGKVK